MDVLFFRCPSCPDGHGVVMNVTPSAPIDSSGRVWNVEQGRIGSLVGLTLSPSVIASCGFEVHVRNGMVEW